MNTKHQVLNSKIIAFVLPKAKHVEMQKQKKQVIQKPISMKYYNQDITERQGIRAVLRAAQR